MDVRLLIVPFDTDDGWTVDGEGAKLFNGAPVPIRTDEDYAFLLRTSNLGRKIINAVGEALPDPIKGSDPWRWASTFILEYLVAAPGSDQRHEHGHALLDLMREALAVIRRKPVWSQDDVALYHAVITYGHAACPRG